MRSSNNPLSVTLSGNGRKLKLQNPVMTASGTFGFGNEFAPFGDLSSLGALVIKALSMERKDGNPMPRIAETASGMLNSIGLQNPGVGVFLRGILPSLKERAAPIVANLYATSVEEFGELAKVLTVDGIAALEVNVSCPNVKEGGLAFGQDAKMVAKVTEEVCRASKLPVIIKLSPNVTDIVSIAKACEDSGATAISCINTLRGMAVDLERRKPRLSTVVGGLSGPAIKPVALRCVWEVSQAVDISVVGVGGICDARDALEFIMAGATAIQVGTGNFIRPDTAFRIVADLPKLMQELKIEDLNSFRGSLEA